MPPVSSEADSPAPVSSRDNYWHSSSVWRFIQAYKRPHDLEDATISRALEEPSINPLNPPPHTHTHIYPTPQKESPIFPLKTYTVHVCYPCAPNEIAKES